MKKIFRFFAAAAVLVAAASCAKEINAPSETGNTELREVAFSAALPASKTATPNDTVAVWKAGDVIKVYDAQGHSGSYTVPADAAKAEFSLKLAGGPYYAAAGKAELVNSTEFSAEDKAFISSSPAAEQSGVFGDADLVFATAANAKLAFKHAFAFVKFTVAANDFSKIEFKSTKAIVGSAVISLEESIPTIEVGDDEAKGVTINTASGSKGTWYVAVLPGAINGFELACTKGGEVLAASHAASISMNSGDVLDLGEIDSRLGKSYKVASMNTFTTLSGNVGGNSGFTYEPFKGTATTAPGVYSNQIRVYQNGGYITIRSVGGDKMSSVAIGSSTGTSVKYSVDGSAQSEAMTIKANTVLAVDNLNADEITFTCVGTTSSTRLNVNYLEVRYVSDSRLAQNLVFDKAECMALLGTSFTAPTLTGAQTSVSFSSSNPQVATVDATTGTVTLVAPGTTAITAEAVANETYKQGRASYNLTVAAPGTGVADIVKAISAETTTPFASTLTNAVVTNKYASSSTSTTHQYTIEQDGVAVKSYYLAPAGGTLEVGSVINGLVTGNGQLYGGHPQLYALDVTAATITSCTELPSTTMTIAALLAAYDSKLYTRVKLENVKVEDGNLVQGSDVIAYYCPSSSKVTLHDGDVINVVVSPEYYTSNNVTVKQAYIYNASDVTYIAAAGVITADTKKSLTIGATWKITASVNSGAELKYSSSNDAVATVAADGTVTAVGGGTAIITISAEASGIYSAAEAKCEITVSSDSSMKSVVFDYVGQKITTPAGATVGDITLATSKGTGSSNPAINATSHDLRIYRYGYITFTSTAGNITKIIFTITDSSYKGSDTAGDTGTLVFDGTTGTWEGDAPTVKVTNTGTDNVQFRIKQIEVFYKG